MKPGEYVVLVFVLLMLVVFFSTYIWFQVKRIKRNRNQNTTQKVDDR